MKCQDLQLSFFPSELSAASAKRGVRSLSIRTGDDGDDDDEDDDDDDDAGPANS